MRGSTTTLCPLVGGFREISPAVVPHAWATWLRTRQPAAPSSASPVLRVHAQGVRISGGQNPFLSKLLPKSFSFLVQQMLGVHSTDLRLERLEGGAILGRPPLCFCTA